MHTDKQALVLLRGGGDLASGIALRLHRTGIRLVITELPQPLAVRRAVSFAETVYAGKHTVEEVTARLVGPGEISAALEANEIPVLVDPEAGILLVALPFAVVIDGRLLKTAPAPLPKDVPLHIGLGPGFHAGVNCHAAIETRRSHTLGRVYWNGVPQPDSGQPEGDPRRVLRAPSDGIMIGHAQIGEHVEERQIIASVQVKPAANTPIHSPFPGVLRGLIHDGVHVTRGMKVGDIDPRDDRNACFLVSDKALAVGGGALEAILTRAEIRENLWG